MAKYDASRIAETAAPFTDGTSGIEPLCDEFGRLILSPTSVGGGSGGATEAKQDDQIAQLDDLIAAAADQLAATMGLATEVTLGLVKTAIESAQASNDGKLDTLHTDLGTLATQATAQAIADELTAQGLTLDSILSDTSGILTGLGILATGADVAAVETACLADDADIASIAATIANQATAAKQDELKAIADSMASDIAAIKSSVADIDTNTDDLETIAGAIRDRLPAAFGASGGVKIDGSGTPLPTSNAAASQADGHSATIGTTTDADTALTLIGRIKKLLSLLPTSLGSGGGLKVDGSGTALPTSSAAGAQADGHSATIGNTADASTANTVIGRLQKLISLLPPALVGGRFDSNTGAWLGSTAPTVGQKTMTNSIPVAVASDNGLATSAKQPAIGTAGSPSADVVTVQGISGGTSLPVTSTSAATELAPSHVRLSSEDGFGRTIMVEPTPVLQATFANGVTFDLWRTYTNGTGTATSTAQTDSLATVSTGATGTSIAELTSADTFSYRAGQSLQPEFTSLFSAPASGGFQVVGVGSNDGFAVGYNGTAFGFLIRRGGVAETRTITITTASTTNQNVTVTLNGVGTSVAVTNSGNTVTTAREIAAGDYSASGLGWDAYQLGSTVEFVSRQPGPLSGSYSLTATTAVGSFAQTLAGVAPTDAWYAKTAWTKDRLDGTLGANNLSNATLDPTKLSVWKVIVPYLGAGPITLQWQDPTTKRWTTCHEVAPANAAIVPTVRNPIFRLWIRASGASNISSSSGSMVLFCDGIVVPNGQQISIPPSFKTTVGNASELPLISVRVERTYNGAKNRYPFRFIQLTTSANATGQVILRFYLNATLTAANFGAVNAFGHPLAYDTSATAATGGLQVGSLITSPNGGSTPIDLTTLNYVLQPGDVVTCTAQQTTGTNATVAVALTGKLDSGSGGI